MNNEFKLVVFADDCAPCECCDDVVCPVCAEHYSDCDCPGPNQDGIEFQEMEGKLYGRTMSSIAEQPVGTADIPAVETKVPRVIYAAECSAPFEGCSVGPYLGGFTSRCEAEVLNVYGEAEYFIRIVRFVEQMDGGAA
jgi:hypothetical protein